MNQSDLFEQECREGIKRLGKSQSLSEATSRWFLEAHALKYSYHFRAFGRPIIQYPQDIVAIQELIWALKPDLIVETGIAHGGSLMLSAGTLALLDYADAAEGGRMLDTSKLGRRVLGIDIDIRPHNREAIEKHPFARKIEMIEGSSIDPATIATVHRRAAEAKAVLVILDSNHTHDHVLAELEAYAQLVSLGSYCVVLDTVIEDLPRDSFGTRPWNVGDNPKTAVRAFLRSLEEKPRMAADGGPLDLVVDDAIESKLLITAGPSGYLRRI